MMFLGFQMRGFLVRPSLQASQSWNVFAEAACPAYLNYDRKISSRLSETRFPLLF